MPSQISDHIGVYRAALQEVAEAKEHANMVRPDFRIKKANDGCIRIFYSVDPQNGRGYWSIQICDYNGRGQTETLSEDDLIDLKHTLQRWFPDENTQEKTCIYKQGAFCCISEDKIPCACSIPGVACSKREVPSNVNT